MKKVIFLLFTLLFPICLSAQMTDNQVIDYVKTEHAKGSSQQAIGASLLQRGVTKNQIEKIKSQIEREKQSEVTTKKSQSDSKSIRTSNFDKSTKIDSIPSDSIGKEIFGKRIFRQKNITFNPEINIPTPANYKLGVGDEVVIEIWGASQTSIRKVISPEGTINIENIGPIYLNGMTVEKANSYIKNKLSSLYAGLSDDEGSSNIQLTLGQIRTIQINVMGEVVVPGTYSLSSLSSIFHALYMAGGINDIGSLREVNLYRRGNKITSIDIYDFLLHGKYSDDIRLSDGDLIIVPPYKSIVNVTGEVRRPMYYEMAEDETVKDLIDYAGGFSGGAFADQIELSRKSGIYNKIFTLKANDLPSFHLMDGDSITVSKGLDLYENRVHITGRIFRPGYYEIGKNIKTVKDLIESAGGLKEDALTQRIILTREKEDLTFKTIALNLDNILSGKDQDILLHKNDELHIASNQVEIDLGDLSIFGMVAAPGSYKYADNTTIKDLILKAGGLLSSASTAKVDVSRRIIDPRKTTNSTTIAKTYSFSIENGFIVDGKDTFVLKPYDQVYIRKSPGYQEQRNVRIEGEILFPGTYTMREKEFRLSDLIKEAGGLTDNSFTEGARLIRKPSEEDIIRGNQTLKMISRGSMEDSISTETLDLNTEYSIGIELDMAMKYPKSEYDIVLKPNDKLFIPEFDNTVSINGAVMYPNTVVYKENMPLKYYIEQAGGFGDLAQKKKAYIVYMNGTIAKGKGSSKDLIKPGCQIIVPSKEKRPPMSIGEKIAIGSSVTSMASVIALLINSLTK